MKINISILILIMLISCSSNKEQQTQDSAHNSFNSLDWEGTYIGTITSEDSKEIEKRITLSKDLTYNVRIKYYGSDKPTELLQKGSFEWYNDGSCIALLINIPKLEPFKFKIEENSLISLNNDGEVTDNSVIYTKLNRIN